MYQITLNTFRKFIRDVTPEIFLSRKFVFVDGDDPDQMEMAISCQSDDRDIISIGNRTHVVNVMMSGISDDKVIHMLNKLIDYDIDIETIVCIKAFEIIADDDWNNKDDDFNHKTRAVDALKYIYKHLQGDMNITEDEAINKACDTLCNLIGDQAFQKFLEDDVE